MSKVNGAGKSGKNGNASAGDSDADSVARKAPKNARVVKPSYKPGTVSRAAIRAAVERVSSSA
ncbi:hypothetical protein [Longimicrobium sp.]|uniref:hypothetical protein n=1 Tax=Longimicrobium sp. TaxID=2029185 RepID=UPI003B39FE91